MAALFQNHYDSILLLVSVLFFLGFIFRRFGKRPFFILALSLLLSGYAAEMICRSLGIGDPRLSKSEVIRVQNEPGGYWTLKPGSKLVYRYPDNPRGYFDEKNEVTGFANSYGFRGKETAKEKRPEDGVRIIVLGDSFTMGNGVRDEDTFPVRMESALKEQGIRAEVMNMGIRGTNTVQQVKLLKKLALDFDPDVILMMMFLNDAGGGRSLEFMRRSKRFDLLRNRSYFVNGILELVERPLMHRRLIRQYLDSFAPESQSWQKVRNAFSEARTITEARGIRLVVGIYPVLYHLDHDYPFRTLHETIREFCRTQDIPVVDLLEAFRGHQGPELWVHRSDQHPNEMAQKIAGDYLASYLQHEILRDPEEKSGFMPTG